MLIKRHTHVVRDFLDYQVRLSGKLYHIEFPFNVYNMITFEHFNASFLSKLYAVNEIATKPPVI